VGGGNVSVISGGVAVGGGEVPVGGMCVAVGATGVAVGALASTVGTGDDEMVAGVACPHAARSRTISTVITTVVGPFGRTFIETSTRQTRTR
jgi:hypothetical protein